MSLTRAFLLMRFAILFGVIALLTVCLHLDAQAQGAGPQIAEASLRLWPEYDDPGLLVVFAGRFSDTVKFPLQVAFPLPAGARGIQATFIDPSGQLLSQPWQVEGGKLIYTLPRPEFQIEYYLDRPPSGVQRELEYTFEAPYQVGALEISVQQPARADGFSLSPQVQRTLQGNDGFTYYQISRENIAAGDKLTFKIHYSKADQGLSVAQTQVENRPTAAPSRLAPANQNVASWLPWLLIGLGLVALAGVGAYWLLERRRAHAVPPAAAMKRRTQAQTSTVIPTANRKTAFRTQCGHPLAPDDRFCAQCGAAKKA